MHIIYDIKKQDRFWIGWFRILTAQVDSVLLRLSITVCFVLYSIEVPKRCTESVTWKSGVWILNIGGNAKMKCVSPDLVGIITKHDIFIVLETWLEGQDQCPK